MMAELEAKVQRMVGDTGVAPDVAARILAQCSGDLTQAYNMLAAMQVCVRVGMCAHTRVRGGGWMGGWMGE